MTKTLATVFILVSVFVLFFEGGNAFQSKVELGTPIAGWGTRAGSPQTISNSFSADDLEDSLLSLLGFNSDAPTFTSTLGAVPEILLFFIEPEVSTQDLLIYSGAHHAITPREDVAFSNLRISLEEKKSVFVENLVLGQSDLAEILAVVAKSQLKQHITSSLIIATTNADDLALSLIDQFPLQAKHVATASELETLLAQNPTLGTNGVTDLVFVYFEKSSDDQQDLTAKFQADDKQIAAIVAAAEATTPDVVSFFSSQFTPTALLKNNQDAPSHALHFVVGREKNNNDTTYNSRFPPDVAEGLMTAAVLIIILFVGVCCLCYTQTPDRFPEAVREGQPNPHILYPHKQ